MECNNGMTQMCDRFGGSAAAALVRSGVLQHYSLAHVPPSRTQSENLPPRVRVVRCADSTIGPDMIISKDLFLLGDQDYLRLPKDEKRTMVRPATIKNQRYVFFFNIMPLHFI